MAALKVRNLITRVNEMYSKYSSISNQTNSSCHEIDWDNVEVIDVAKTYRKLLFKEMLYIDNLEPTMN